MDILVKGRLITHLEMNNMMGDSTLLQKQTYSYSCMTSLLDFFAQVIDTYDMDNNKAVDLVNLDFKKAFDKVPKTNAKSHGIHGDAARRIRNCMVGWSSPSGMHQSIL